MTAEKLPPLTRIELNDFDRERVERAKQDLAQVGAALARGDQNVYRLLGRLEVVAEDLLRILDNDGGDGRE